MVSWSLVSRVSVFFWGLRPFRDSFIFKHVSFTRHFAFSSIQRCFRAFSPQEVFHGMDFPGKSEGRISLGQGWRVWICSTGPRVPPSGSRKCRRTTQTVSQLAYINHQ